MADSVFNEIDEAACRWCDTLLRDGYCIIPDLVSAYRVAALASDLDPVFERTPLSEGVFYGTSTRRFHGLLARTSHAAAFVGHPLILAIARAVLTACDAIQLNLTQAIELIPGAPMQPPHRDEEMWPLCAPGVEYLINVMWPFVPYTAENGAMLVWPGSHRREPDPSEIPIAAEMSPGAALLFLGSALHCGGENRSEASRRGMIVSYSLGWLKPYELPWLAYPQRWHAPFHLRLPRSPATARTVPIWERGKAAARRSCLSTHPRSHPALATHCDPSRKSRSGRSWPCRRDRADPSRADGLAAGGALSLEFEMTRRTQAGRVAGCPARHHEVSA